MLSKRVLISILSILASANAQFTNGTLSGSRPVPLQGGSNGGNAASSFGTSVPCQNARDASIAGTVVAHQLLTMAQQMTPGSDATFSMEVGNALTAVTRALAFVGSLATSAAGQAPPSLQDLGPLNSALSGALVSVTTTLQNQAKQASSSKLDETNLVIGQIALVSINGPVVLSEQSVNVMASPAENLLIQTSLQIQSALEAILFSTSCIGGTLMTPVPMNITLPNTNITATPDTPINGTNIPLGNSGNGGNGDNGVTNTTVSSNNTTTPDNSNIGGVDITSATLLPESLPSATADLAVAATSVAAYPLRLSKSSPFKGWKGYGGRSGGW